MTTPDLNSEGGNMVSQRQVEELRADEGGVSQSQPIIGSVPLPTREAEEPAALTPGQHLQAIHHAYFNGGGWVDPLTWDDYDEAGHARWEAFAAVIGRNIAKAAAAPDLLEACLHVRRVNAKAAAEGYLKPEEWGAELFACNAALSAAITKATNEASPLGAEPGSTGIDGGREEQITQPSHDDEGLIERLRACANGVGSLKTDLGDFGLLDQAANTISRLKGELEETVLQIEYLHQKFGETGSGNAVLAKARSLLSPSQDVGLSSARASRDARSSTRPEGPCSDEGGEA